MADQSISRLMRLEPLSDHEVRKLREAHGHAPQCLTCNEPQRCLMGMLLDTLAQKCPDTVDTARKAPPPAPEF